MPAQWGEECCRAGEGGPRGGGDTWQWHTIRPQKAYKAPELWTQKQTNAWMPVRLSESLLDLDKFWASPSFIFPVCKMCRWSALGAWGLDNLFLQPYFGLIYSDWFAYSSLTTNWLFHITEITRGSSFLAQFIVFGLSFPSGWWGCKEKTSKTPALSVPAKWSFSYLLSNCFVENYLFVYTNVWG